MKLQNHVISLSTAHDRRQHIENEFGEQGIEFEFFDAITPDLIEVTCQKLGIDLTQNQRLSNGEKAVFLSHVCLWQKMIDEDIKYLAIFEDDVYLGENAHLFLNNDTWVQAIDFDIIKLETWKELVHLGKNSIDVFERQLKPLKSTHVGMAGYIINQKSAKKTLLYLKSLPSDYIFAIDHVVFGALLTELAVYQVCPALAMQADRLEHNHLSSQLTTERKDNTFRYQTRDGVWVKFKKLIKRIYRSIGKRTFYQIVPFQ